MEEEQNIIHYGLNDCGRCNGEGVVYCDYCDPDDHWNDHCASCDDSGVVRCPNCGGTGESPVHSDYQEAYRMMITGLGFVERFSIQIEKLRPLIERPYLNYRASLWLEERKRNGIRSNSGYVE